MSLIFNKYAYQIDQLNAAFRIFIKHGTIDVRQFDENGIPFSRSAKYKDGFISPFYVVHYGLLYSMDYAGKYSGEHWKFNETHELWNVPPPKTEAKFFKNSADWITDNMEELNGHYHLIYHFDWIYKGYPNDMLKSPWYSGLTDGYALLLLLRAYDIYQDEKYFRAATKLYKSVIAPYEEGGSLTSLTHQPWIEEYVQSGLKSDEMAYVFNGMVYATYGVYVYEKLHGNINLSKKLLTSINQNIGKFGTGCWSQYDLIGNPANLKYHRIHIGLISELIQLEDELGMDSRPLKNINWECGSKNPGFHWVSNANFSFGLLHFILTYLSLLILPALLRIIRFK